MNSSIFDSFRYLGASLVSDDNMLPPNLRGYAPEVKGVAETNARVTVSQQGRVLYETTVAAGPFSIQDLNSATSGTLDVTVTEQNGTVRTFQVNTASIPYLTRPGLVRYKFAMGKPTDYERNAQGPGFVSSEFSWGVNNGWSLYGGSVIGGSDYNVLALGIGRDLLAFGALSFDLTQSRASLPGHPYTGSRTYDRLQPLVSVTFRGVTDEDNPALLKVQGTSGLALRLLDDEKRDVRLNSRGVPRYLTPDNSVLTYYVVPERTAAHLVVGAYRAVVNFGMNYD